MHRQVIRGPGQAPARDERGAIAIIAAVSLTMLLVVGGLVLDFGLVRVDRQIDKSAADSATLAGLHALNTGDGNPHPYTGVCTAIRYLKANSARFSGVSETSGWQDGLGAVTGNGCSSTALRNKTCSPTDKSSWAKWQWTGISGGLSLNVTIESGYSFTGSTWPEDTLPASSPDTGDSTQQGCDQLAVTISQGREPGLGSLATDRDLKTEIRSVGRVKPVAGDSAPAMLLLRQTGCPILKTGSNSGGSFVHVLGAVSSNGLSQPGTIHADSDGVGCTGGSNSNVYGGLANSGIVAYAAPLASSPTLPDAAKPGLITSVAAANGMSSSVVRDSLNNVYGSSALTTGGTKAEVTGRSLITRRLVDERYFPGVKGAIAGATGLFATGASGPIATWTKFPASVNACKPTPGEVASLAPPLTSTSKLYIDCAGKFIGDAAGLTINAGTVYFRGWVNPAKTLKMPNAHHVYIGNHGDNSSAIDLATNTSFEMNMTGNTSPSTGTCTSGQSASKAVLFVRSGLVKESSGILRMCRTTAFMMGGGVTPLQGCVPATTGTAPTSTPCLGVNSGLGTGQWSQTGGDVDWTAPNTLDVTTDPATGNPTAGAIAAWGDVNGPEDLALWSESASGPSDKFSMAGTGLFNVRGVFMIPNAEPVTISGGATMNLVNAQYVASSIELNGNTTSITMSVDPNSAVTLPDLGLVGLVR